MNMHLLGWVKKGVAITFYADSPWLSGAWGVVERTPQGVVCERNGDSFVRTFPASTLVKSAKSTEGAFGTPCCHRMASSWDVRLAIFNEQGDVHVYEILPPGLLLIASARSEVEAIRQAVDLLGRRERDDEELVFPCEA